MVFQGTGDVVSFENRRLLRVLKCVNLAEMLEQQECLTDMLETYTPLCEGKKVLEHPFSVTYVMERSRAKARLVTIGLWVGLHRLMENKKLTPNAFERAVEEAKKIGPSLPRPSEGQLAQLPAIFRDLVTQVYQLEDRVKLLHKQLYPDSG